MIKGIILLISGVAAWLMAGTFSSSNITPPTSSIEYRAFDGAIYTLYPWKGKNIAFLAPEENLDVKTMSIMISKLDAAWDFYKETTGKTPRRFSRTEYDGLPTVAVVDKTCGAGCGYVGYYGIELSKGVFDSLYNGVKDGSKFNQTPFYEMGRNFWLFSDKINYMDGTPGGAIGTGYAVLMRFASMEAAGAKGENFKGYTFGEFKNEVKSLVDKYEADPSMNWENTLWIGKAPANKMGLGATDLFASLMMRLADMSGNKNFLKDFFAELDKLPNRANTQEALDNLMIAASAAAKMDFTNRFEAIWRWPVSNGARASMAMFNNPPIIEKINRKRIKVGKQLSIQIKTKDMDNDNVSLSSQDLPEGASLGASGLLEWQPKNKQKGKHEISLTASDGKSQTEQLMKIRVR